MSYTQEDVLQFIEENDVKFVRLSFCDIFGVPKNVAIMADQLPHVFGHGAGFDVSAVEGFMNIEESDLLLFPDPASLQVLPWRPSTGRVVRMFCDIRHPDGSPFVGDGRSILRRAVQKAAAMGYSFRIGTECEFYLFRMDDEDTPTLTPHDRAGYLDIAPLDKSENIRRDICLALEEMGLYPQGSHHEKGPGQNEIWCASTDPLRAADDFITYKSVVRTIAAGYGLFACFMPKPLADKSGNGLHINLHLRRMDGGDEAVALQSFMAGILQRVREATLFLNTTTNSYRRFGSFDAPEYISWSAGNRAQLLRMPAPRGGAPRVELRSPDPLCNPYLAFSLLLEAGLEGVRKGLTPEAPADFDFATADESALAGYQALPGSLGEAVQLAENSLFIKSCLPAGIIDKTIGSKKREWADYLNVADQQSFEHKLYFERT